MRFCRAKTAESATKGAKRRSGQDAAPLAADDQPQCGVAGASGTARRQEQAKDPYRRQRTPLWKRTSKTAPRPAPEPLGLDAAIAPAAGDVEKVTKPFKTKTPAAAASVLSVSEEALALEEPELVHREQQTSCTSVYEGEGATVLEGYGVELPADPDQTPPGPSRPADDEDDDDSDTDDTATDEAVGSTPSTATVCTSVGETAASDRLSAELKVLVSMVEMTTGSPVRCTSSTRASTGEAGRKAEAAAADTPAAEGDGEGLRTWQRNFLGRLTRARQRRDIRLNRKEVLSMQLLLETVLRQHMALSREVEAVKANIQREGVEPVSLSRALSRLQAERTEEAAALDKILACKDRELRGAQAQLEQARRQVGVLEQSCREKDADLEKAALALATVHSMHRKGMQDKDRQLQEQLEALRAETAARHQADLASQLDELRRATKAELEAAAARREEREAALLARLSTLRTDAAAKESRLEMESLRMSRALTEHEAHLARLMTTVEQLQLQLRDARAEAAASAAALQAARADQEDAAVLVSKALSARDQDAQHAREAAEAARREYESQLQELRAAAEVLRSQQDVQALGYSQALNEKDLRISAMIIDVEDLRAALADADARLTEAKEANADLLKTVEAMNGQLQHSFGQLGAQAAQLQAQGAQLESQDAQLQAQGAQMEAQAAQLDAQAADAEQLRGRLAQAQGDAEEARRAYKEARAEAERLRRAQQDAVAERDRVLAALNDLHANSEAEIARLQRGLREHQHDVEEAARLRRALDKLRTSSAAEAEALRKEMQGLHDGHVAEVTRVQAALREAKDKRKAEAEHFRKALHEKDVQIRDIQDQFAKFRLDQDEARDELQARKEALEREVGVLKNSVSQMKSAHKERVSELDKKAGELGEQARRLKQDAEQARAEQREQAQRAREAERARAQAEQDRARLEERLSDLQRQRDELLVDAEHLTKQRDNCQVVVDEKEHEVLALRDKIERLEARALQEEDGGLQEALQEARQELQGRAEEAARLRSELGEALEQREALLAKVSKLFKVVRRSFDRRTSEKAALELELNEARAQLSSAVQSHQAEQDKLMKMMLGKENEMKQLRENLHQYEDHLRSTREEMDATNALLKRNIVELEREVRRRDADLRHRDAELERLQAVQEEVTRLQAAEQQALERAAQLEASLEAGRRRQDELELELEVGRTLLKKNTEESRLKMEKLQQGVENVRAERDSELTVLKDAVARMQTELVDRDRQLQQVKAEGASQVLGLQHALNGRQDEAERLTDESERLHRENEALRAKEAELRESIAYLEGEAEAVRERDQRIAVLEEEQRRMAEVLQDAVRRDEQEHQHVAEALQEAARAKEAELAALRDDHRRQVADAAEAARRKDEQIAALEETVETLRTGLDLDLLRLKDQLSDSENERMQLSAQASMLEAQLQDQISLMSKQIADKDEEIRELAEARRERAELAEENAQLLGIMQRMKKEREAMQAEMQEAIKTTNGALRAKEDRLESLREEAAEAAALRQRLEEAERAAAEAGELRQRLDALEAINSRQHKEQDFLRAQLEKSRRDAHEADRRAAEAVRAPGQEEGDVGHLEAQLRARQLEVDKLKQTVEMLRADVGLQKQLLLTFHEGRAYLGAISEHDSLSKTARFIFDPRNTAELTALPQPQDGDHCPPGLGPGARPHRRPQFELKRTHSDGDNVHLMSDMSISTTSGFTVSSLDSEFSTTQQDPFAVANPL